MELDPKFEQKLREHLEYCQSPVSFDQVWQSFQEHQPEPRRMSSDDEYGYYQLVWRLDDRKLMMVILDHDIGDQVLVAVPVLHRKELDAVQASA